MQSNPPLFQSILLKCKVHKCIVGSDFEDGKLSTIEFDAVVVVTVAVTVATAAATAAAVAFVRFVSRFLYFYVCFYLFCVIVVAAAVVVVFICYVSDQHLPHTLFI